MREKPNKSPYLHWCQSGLFAEGGPQHPSLAPYACPAPEPGTGAHRFVFLLQVEGALQPQEDLLTLLHLIRYREPLPYEVGHTPGVQLPGESLKREKFPIEEFVRNNKLTLASLAIAARASGQVERRR